MNKKLKKGQVMEYKYDKIETDFHEFKWKLGIRGTKLAIIDENNVPVTDFIYKPLLLDPLDAKTQSEFDNWKRRWGYDCLVFQKLNNKMGVIDKDLNEIIPFIYDDIEIYQDGPPSYLTLFIVKKDSKFGLLDYDNNILLDCVYEKLSYCVHEEITFNDIDEIIINEDKKYGIIDFENRVLIEFKYEGSEETEKAIENNMNNTISLCDFLP